MRDATIVRTGKFRVPTEIRSCRMKNMDRAFENRLMPKRGHLSEEVNSSSQLWGSESGRWQSGSKGRTDIRAAFLYGTKSL